MLQGDFIKHIQNNLLQKEGIESRNISIRSVAGGDINAAYRIQTPARSFFIKTNDGARSEEMFEQEAMGLRTLVKGSEFRVPCPLMHGKWQSKAYLVLEWIAIQRLGNEEAFGEYLASMHQTTQSQFGFQAPNFIGSLPQRNTYTKKWSDFYILHRLEPLVEAAYDQGALSREVGYRFNRLFGRLESFYPSEPPALLHGDLWSGNKGYDEKGTPCIFDPAVYFGHREIDLAMTRLFGGFSPEMYRAYNHRFPLETQWEERIPIGQLYPLMVHVILFGGGYAFQVETILKKFT